MHFVILVLIITVVVHISKPDRVESKRAPVLVAISQGKVEGMTLISRLGTEYFGFKGMRYAQVPLRFASAQRADNWEGVFHANQTASPCFQFRGTDQRFIGIEDCLTLDIYTPKLEGNLPVAFWIHSGGFQMGTGTVFEGKYFADASVVLVTINYRLGALGFLNTEDGQVLGNMGNHQIFTGLKDQVKAMEWIKDNIRHFGGNPAKVMLFGNSAGGSSVEYHMLSSRSTGLFSTGYSHSGTALNPWAFQRNPRKNALAFAKHAGCAAKNSTAKFDIACLRSKNATELGIAQLKLKTLPIQFDLLNMVFCPSVESPMMGNDSFLTDSPFNLLSKHKIKNNVPWLVAVAKEEGLFWTTPYLDNNRLARKLNNEWTLMAPKIFLYDDEDSKPKKVATSQRIREFYLKDKKINSTTRHQVSAIYTDRFFLNGVIESMRLHLQKPSPEAPIYAAVLNFPGIYSYVQSYFKVKEFHGTTHSDKLQYLFNQTSGSPEHVAGSPIGNFSANLIKQIVTFAETGKLEWEPVTSVENLSWYELGSESKKMENIYAKGYNFWKGLNLKENVAESEDFQLAPRNEQGSQDTL